MYFTINNTERYDLNGFDKFFAEKIPDAVMDGEQFDGDLKLWMRQGFEILCQNKTSTDCDGIT